MRIYVEARGVEMPAMTFEQGTSALEVMARLPGVYLRQPTHWERTVERIADDPTYGTVVSPDLREQHPLIRDYDEWDT